MKKRFVLLMLLFIILITSEAFAKKVIGVSAFTNLTKDNNITWLEIGIADSVSYKLRNVAEYIVVDRTNVDKLMQEVALGQTGVIDEASAKEAGKALGADLIVVGNFQKFGNQVRISARIVEVESHKVLKQVQATGILDQIFDLQDQIALKIIDETNVSITSSVKERIKNNATRNLSAYEYFVKGQKFLLFQLDYLEAIKMYNKAISIDKNYSLAYAGLGKAYSLRSWELRNYYNKNDPSLVEKSYRNSKKALEIDPNLDEAHVSLARYYQEVDQKKVPNKWKLCEQSAR
ncbi:MAG TPA: CsgG/HfaB family protein, partial [Spirochaetota bacterium]|nr:CsgG/HfaB family protein [Spirochaetota bacterium]